MSEAALRTRTARPERAAGPNGWTSSYDVPTGAADLFLDAGGEVRPVWQRFLREFGERPVGEVDRRFAAAERHVRDTGASYRVHGEGEDRAWPIGTLPVLVDGAEWRDLAAGIVQRATLLEAVLRDVYGAGTLVASGALPASLVAGCPDFIRPVHGIAPPGGRWLHLYAADLVRGPGGRWIVVSDRTQAPSGAGYALENRLVLARAFPEAYEAMDVERLAPFFAAFRRSLAAAADRSDPRLCLLTPGPLSETYFEQAYLARYLGLLLVEGDDLLVRDGHVQVRTVSGLKRADVLWRRVDGDFLDPLELNPASRLGVTGLLDALRSSGVVVGNMPGSGLVEAAGLAPFLPCVAERLFGEALRLDGLPSWWGGDPDGLARIRAAGEEIDLLSASDPAGGAAGDRPDLLARLAERPGDVVGRAKPPLSTTPVLEDGRLVARPCALRVFAAATADGWTVMPGAFCRIGRDKTLPPAAMGPGTRSADLWVVSDEPVRPVSLLPRAESVRVRRIAGHLPSRAADNLFWFGRYLERAECVVRLVRALLTARGDEDASARGPVVAILARWGCVAPRLGSAGTGGVLAQAAAALCGEAGRPSARSHLASARGLAAKLRERLSAETWRALAEAADALAPGPDRAPTPAELRDAADAALVALSAIAGIVGENMNRAAGWHFAEMGRRTERAINTTEIARALARPDAALAELTILLDVIDSQITFGARYILGASLVPVRDIALLDPYNPRSVAFQVASLGRHLAELPDMAANGLPDPHVRACRKLAGDLAASDATEVDDGFMADLESRLEGLADLISARYFPGGPEAERPAKLTDLA